MVVPRLYQQMIWRITSVTVVLPRLYQQMIWQITTQFFCSPIDRYIFLPIMLIKWNVANLQNRIPLSSSRYLHDLINIRIDIYIIKKHLCILMTLSSSYLLNYIKLKVQILIYINICKLIRVSTYILMCMKNCNILRCLKVKLSMYLKNKELAQLP